MTLTDMRESERVDAREVLRSFRVTMLYPDGGLVAFMRVGRSERELAVALAGELGDEDDDLALHIEEATAAVRPARSWLRAGEIVPGDVIEAEGMALTVGVSYRRGEMVLLEFVGLDYDLLLCAHAPVESPRPWPLYPHARGALDDRRKGGPRAACT
jgi:hypothetical protein